MPRPPTDDPTPRDTRLHRRIFVPAAYEIRVTASGNGLVIEGVATIVGLGGMYLRSRKQPPPGSSLNFRVDCPGLSFEAIGQVRDVADTGMGVEYMVITQENEEKLKLLLAELAQLQI